ncbi:MAG TPA: sigma-70 family RNA polymerase sigma factor [Mycobacteriales bacterium]|nr:sigma-70 family RNA polymerase sigma factor [Mycobacteriales bacterium]
MDDAPLEDALRAAQAGQAWAARVLYEELSPRVLGYLRAKGAAEPEDLTSEVFLTVFGRIGTVTGGMAGLRTFAFSVAHARLVDEYRRRARRQPATEYAPESDPRTSTAAEDDGLVAVQTARVRALLDTLASDQRDVLVLRILGDLSVEQVAEVLGTSEGAVKQRQRRGLLALRKRLERAGITTIEGVTL